MFYKSISDKGNYAKINLLALFNIIFWALKIYAKLIGFRCLTKRELIS